MEDGFLLAQTSKTHVTLARLSFSRGRTGGRASQSTTQRLARACTFGKMASRFEARVRAGETMRFDDDHSDPALAQITQGNRIQPSKHKLT